MKYKDILTDSASSCMHRYSHDVDRVFKTAAYITTQKEEAYSPQNSEIRHSHVVPFSCTCNVYKIGLVVNLGICRLVPYNDSDLGICCPVP